ncbi:MAG: hypothetical protein BMS9Abin12_2316 [Acidimicrobiia bacterium]|nr:MAG: hypothetical protein BMS9Abin12_2316 [Acidimicrobiia bacterium]
MRFSGQVWFDFSSPAVWTFYRWVRLLAVSGAEVALEWLPYPNDSEQAAMATLLGIEDSQDRGRFIHAMLGLVHLENSSPSEMTTIIDALRAAELDSVIVAQDHPLLGDLSARCKALAIEAVPSLVRHGPVLSIQLNPAVLNAEPQQVARTINDVIESDGIWELRKP